MKPVLACLLCLLAFPIYSWAQDASDVAHEGRFARANLAFENGDWPSAIQMYSTILDAGVQSWALHFNLGKAFFKNNEPGPAVLHLEQARLLAPSNVEIRETLFEVREKFTIPSAKIPTWQRWARWATPNSWIVLLVTAGWITILAFSIPYIKTVRFFETTAFHFLRGFSLFCTVVGIAGFALTQDWYEEAVIFEESAYLKLAPTEHSPELRSLHPGELARIHKTAREHTFITTSDGSSGWVISENIQPLWQ